MTHGGTIHAVINSAKLLQDNLHHILHAVFISDVHLHGYCSVCGIFCKFLAFLSCNEGAVSVDVCKDDTFRANFGEAQGCLFANTAGSLFRVD